jgi:hypothetical protein
MPRWVNNPADVPLNAVYVQEDAELEIAEVVTFESAKKPDGKQAWGVRVKVKFMNGEYKDKSFSTVMNLGNDEFGAQMAKQFQIAAYGYERENEAEFDAWARDQDWEVNSESKYLGEAWTKMKGKVIKADLSTKTDATGVVRQTTVWKPFKG